MGQVPIYDFGPDPLAVAAGKFGEGFSSKLLQNIEQKKQEDALSGLLGGISEQTSQQDVLKQILGERNIPFQQRVGLYDAISNVRQQTRQQQAADQLAEQMGLPKGLTPEQIQKQSETGVKIQKQQIDEYKKAERKKKLVKAGLPEPLADLYSEATVGGQTELIKYLRELRDREGIDYLTPLLQAEGIQSQDVFDEPSFAQPTDGVQQPPQALQTPQQTQSIQATQQTQTEPTPIAPIPEVPERTPEDLDRGEPKVDPDKGLTRDQKIARENARYGSHLPIYQEAIKQKNAIEKELLSFNEMNRLNDEDLLEQNWYSRINRNPFTGQILIPALASDEEQQFQKLVNDFTVRAKESFGARVTNFELDRFMQRLPTLANSKGGRKRILRQMEIIDRLNLLESQGLIDSFDKHGLRKYDFNVYKNISDKQNRKEVEKLKKEFSTNNSTLNKNFDKRVSEAKKQVPKGNILMLTPEGKMKHFPSNNESKLEAAGYQKL